MRGVGSAITRLATMVHFSSRVSPSDLFDLDRIVVVVGVGTLHYCMPRSGRRRLLESKRGIP